MKDVRLTQSSKGGLDIFIENASFQWVTDGEQAGQHGSIRVLTVKGERKIDLSDGTDFYGIIFDHQKSRREKELEFRRRILTTPGINKVIAVSWSQHGHVLSFSATTQTDWGGYTISTEFELL